jgi:hypothetical protein
MKYLLDILINFFEKIKFFIYYKFLYRAKYKIYHILKKTPFTSISIFFLVIFFIVDFIIKNKNSSISNLNISWEAIIAIVTALAWVSQHKLNKKLLEKERIIEQKERLENFKNNKIKNIVRSFRDSLQFWFIYTFEEYKYKIDNNHWSYPKYNFRPIKELSYLSLARKKHKYDYQKRSYVLNSSNYEDIKEINLKTFGVVYKDYKFLFSNTQIIAKGNANTDYFDKLGRLFCSGQSFETFKINENKLSHIILKNLNGVHSCIFQLLISLLNIKNDFEDQNLRIEAYKLLFQEDSYLEIYEIIKIVFWFKQQNFARDSHRQARVMKIIKMMFKKYKYLKQIDGDLKKLESLFFDLFGTSFLNSHPHFD